MFFRVFRFSKKSFRKFCAKKSNSSPMILQQLISGACGSITGSKMEIAMNISWVGLLSYEMQVNMLTQATEKIMINK